MASASRELLAAPGEVWSFLAEPHHLSDWWPGVVGVEPDRRGFAPGARWGVQRRGRRGLLGLEGGGWQGPVRSETLVIGELVPERRLAFALVAQARGALPARSVHVAISLAPTRPDRTRVTVSVESARLRSSDRLTAHAAVERLHALVQTAAEA